MKNVQMAEEMKAISIESSAGKWLDRSLTQSKLDLLRAYMEAGRRKEWIELLRELREKLQNAPIHELLYLEIYHSLVLTLLSVFNQSGLSSNREVLLRYTQIMEAHRNHSKEAALAGLEELFDLYFEMRATTEPTVCDPIALVKAYIAAHLSGDLSLAHLAEMAYLHPDYLSRLFKLSEGVTLKQYITARKLDYAIELLAHSRLSAKTIARRLGFASPGYFTQMFKRETGLTPQSFRARI
ncbi:AraC family transcriptional regulator [Paenibacillus sp. HB172176]|uniref:helix-turn-helix transcriptional regulator n=1 Tax=Paenibacillus sp. HB172176 TaxID=2493690 RepID=UPI00143B60C2|nr:AraC family transcriptional regulator [Paenibacillus sp. HB172176]